MPGYEYDDQHDMFMSHDLLPIKKQSSIRHKIFKLGFEKNGFLALSHISDDFLGVIQLWPPVHSVYVNAHFCMQFWRNQQAN